MHLLIQSNIPSSKTSRNFSWGNLNSNQGWLDRYQRMFLTSSPSPPISSSEIGSTSSKSLSSSSSDAAMAVFAPEPAPGFGPWACGALAGFAWILALALLEVAVLEVAVLEVALLEFKLALLELPLLELAWVLPRWGDVDFAFIAGDFDFAFTADDFIAGDFFPVDDFDSEISDFGREGDCDFRAGDCDFSREAERGDPGIIFDGLRPSLSRPFESIFMGLLERLRLLLEGLLGLELLKPLFNVAVLSVFFSTFLPACAVGTFPAFLSSPFLTPPGRGGPLDDAAFSFFRLAADFILFSYSDSIPSVYSILLLALATRV